MDHSPHPNAILPSSAPQGVPSNAPMPGLAQPGATTPTQNEMLQSISIRAKQLFERPGINPRDQSRALQLLKAQYVYAKYHINLKVPQE